MKKVYLFLLFLVGFFCGALNVSAWEVTDTVVADGYYYIRLDYYPDGTGNTGCAVIKQCEASDYTAFKTLYIANMQLVNDDEHARCLFVGQRADGGIMVFLGVVVERLQLQVFKHPCRDGNPGIGVIVGAVYGVHDVSGHDESHHVLAMGHILHVVERSGTAAQTQCEDDIREHQVFVFDGKTMYLALYGQAHLIDGLYQLIPLGYFCYFCFHKYRFWMQKYMFFLFYARKSELLS